jgi:glycosyltransferase involved in cell wall biosynthesis
VRLGVFTDYSYRRDGGQIYAERAFVLFLARVSASLERTVVVGRLDPRPGPARYRLPGSVEFVPLPYYETQLRPLAMLAVLPRTLAGFWRALGRVDAVWLLGPNPLAFAFATLALLRRRAVVLGVRQDLPPYTRSRHPGRRPAHVAADALDAGWRMLARRLPVIVVGPALAHRYRRSRRLLAINVSLISESEIVAPERADARRYEGELRALSVGRLETEKNPLLLADVLARVDGDDGRWRLVVCGEGPLAPALEQRLRELGVGGRAELPGYVPIDTGLRKLYGSSHALLHVSWTEGLPQVLFEAFAAGLPVVATAVGGVPEAVGDAVLLVPPGDAEAAAQALERIAADEALRARMVRAGNALAHRSTIETESARVVEFLRAADRAHR